MNKAINGRWWASFSLDNRLARLLLAIGHPRKAYAKSNGRSQQFDSKLLKLASNNKVPLLYLCSIKETSVEVERYLRHYLCRFKSTLELMSYISDVFDKARLGYAFFKTIKPFMFTPSDVDLLIESRLDLKKAVMVLQNHEMEMVNKDLLSVTFFSRKWGLFIDLYLQPTVLDLPYLNKEVLFEYITTIDVDDYAFKSVSPCADVVVTAAHAFFKEQMFNLSDFYTLLIYGESVKICQLKDLSSATLSSLPLEAAYFLTELVSRLAFGLHCPASECVDLEKHWQLSLTTKVKNTPIKMPLKYSFPLIFFYLLSKGFKEPYFRSAFVKSVRTNASSVKLKKLLEYWKRQAY